MMTIKRTITTLMLFVLAGAGSLPAQVGAPYPWSLAPDGDQPPPLHDRSEGMLPLSFERGADPLHRPRLTIALAPRPQPLPPAGTAAFSWSLEAWELNTASLAHIQCSRATRSIESFLVEDCRFVDHPAAAGSDRVVRLKGNWQARPNLAFGAGVFSGRRERISEFGFPAGTLLAAAVPGGSLAADRIDGANVSLGLNVDAGRAGQLLLDLQLERYRQRPQSPFAFTPALADGTFPAGLNPNGYRQQQYRTEGALGLTWRGRQFGADVTGQYQELPYWFGEQLEGDGFRSFDIEFSWRAPARASISVGVSNVLDRLPGGASQGVDHNVEAAVDSIYGRIPYVRYKHDL